jgi:hypothetical protein
MTFRVKIGRKKKKKMVDKNVFNSRSIFIKNETKTFTAKKSENSASNNKKHLSMSENSPSKSASNPRLFIREQHNRSNSFMYSFSSDDEESTHSKKNKSKAKKAINYRKRMSIPNTRHANDESESSHEQPVVQTRQTRRKKSDISDIMGVADKSIVFGNSLPHFVSTIRKPRKLTNEEIRMLNVSEKFVQDAHHMLFYPPGLAFIPRSRKY